jgi:hypothetical protein
MTRLKARLSGARQKLSAVPDRKQPKFRLLMSGGQTMLMTLAPSRSALENTVLSLRHPKELIKQLVGEIAKDLLAHSQYIRVAQFRAIHPRDLDLLFCCYDKRFFAGLLQRALAGRNLTFRPAPRMTRAGGTTTKPLNRRSGQVSYEIVISSSLLFHRLRNFAYQKIRSSC